MLVDIASHSPELLRLCADSGLLPCLISDLKKDDPLLQMASLEVVQDLAATSHGLQYLKEVDAIEKAAQLLTPPADDPLGSLTQPGAFKFFTGLVCLDTAGVRWLGEHVPTFLPALMSSFDGLEMSSLFPVVVDTFCMVASRPDGMKFLLDHPSHGSPAFTAMKNAIRTAPTEVRVRCLDSLCSVFRTPVCDLDQATVTRVETCWYSAPCDSRMSTAELLWQVARQPFMEVRQAALHTLAAMVAWPFIATELLSLSGFVEYALDRRTESERAGKEAKYELVKQLALSETVKTSLDAPIMMKFRLYVREGPLFVLPESAVKTGEE